MQPGIRLTPTSYIVLGLLSLAGTATPYELKAALEASVGDFWSVPHAQVYSEPERLAEAGLLSMEREESGRRRKRYTLTAEGRAALRAWLEQPTGEMTELRDPGLLQLFFGAKPGPLAREQLSVHRAQLRHYEELHGEAGDVLAEGQRLALEAGIRHEREWVRYWSELVDSKG